MERKKLIKKPNKNFSDDQVNKERNGQPFSTEAKQLSKFPIIYWYNELPVVLVEHDTGIMYCGQAGGMICGPFGIEGFPIPLDDPEWRQLYGLSHPDACCIPGLSDELLNRLEQNWPKQENKFFYVKLDRSRAEKGIECWFPVMIEKGIAEHHFAKKDSEFLVGKKGFLLMPDNCD